MGLENYESNANEIRKIVSSSTKRRVWSFNMSSSANKRDQSFIIPSSAKQMDQIFTTPLKNQKRRWMVKLES